MPRRFAVTFLLSAVAASAALAAAAHAQEDSDPYARCAAMADGVQRLGCFDATYAERQVRQAEQERIAAEQARRAEERRAAEFGLSEFERLERRADEVAAGTTAAAEVARLEEEEARAREFSVTAAVVSASDDGAGNRVVRLDNGHVWRETSGSTMKLFIRPGWQATVARRWSGTYEMRFEGRSGFLRVERVR